MTDKSVIDTIIAEAGGSEAGMRAVAAVIANRAAQTGLTPAQVVKQSGQFEGYSNPGRGSREAQKVGRLRDMAERAFTDISTGKVADPTHGSTSFRTAGTKIHAPHGTVEIAGNVFAKGSKALDAINAAAPTPQSKPPALGYASAPASTPALPRPRPSEPFNLAPPDLPLNAPIAQGSGRSWGPLTPNWAPQVFDKVAQQAPATRSVPTIAIRASTPGGFDTVGSGPHQQGFDLIQQALKESAPKAPTLADMTYVSGPVRPGSLRDKIPTPPNAKTHVDPTPPTVAAPKTAYGAADPMSIFFSPKVADAAPRFGTGGTSSNLETAPSFLTGMLGRSSPASAPPVPPSPVRVASIPGPSGYFDPNKDASQLHATTALAFGSPVQQAPAVQAITHQIVNPAYTAWLKAGQAYTAGGNIVTQAQQNAFGGMAPNTNIPTVPLPRPRPAPPQYITQTVQPAAPARIAVAPKSIAPPAPVAPQRQMQTRAQANQDLRDSGMIDSFGMIK